MNAKPLIGPDSLPNAAPEVKVHYQRAGMESLAAIDEELKTGAQDSVPEIQIGEAPLGRETLQAIEEELATPIIHISWPDSDADTVRNMRAAAPPPESALPSRPRTSPPPLPTAQAEESASAETATEPDIYELLTFVVRGNAGAQLTTDVLRRRFVERYLLRRLPVETMNDVERVDVSPGSLPGTLVIRVWCKLQAALEA